MNPSSNASYNLPASFCEQTMAKTDVRAYVKSNADRLWVAYW